MNILENQQIVVISGSSGIGLAVAKLLTQKGANVTISSRSKERLEKAASVIGYGVQIGTINTLDESSVKEFFTNFEQIDRVLCFAGDSMGGGVLNSDIATAQNAIRSKFWEQFYVGRYGGSKIKSTGSLTLTAGSGPRPHQAIATVAANAGVSLLAESLAKELAPVRVNVVSSYYTRHLQEPKFGSGRDFRRLF
jgi:NAD(P)-dependent dehydrogenase (short-subunit alcohol dehydrogenase family)